MKKSFMMIIWSFYGHSKEGYGGCMSAWAPANTQGGLAGLCSSPRHRKKPPWAVSWEEGYIIHQGSTQGGGRGCSEVFASSTRPCLRAEVSSVCMWHCGTSDHCCEARRVKKKKKKRLKFCKRKQSSCGQR